MATSHYRIMLQFVILKATHSTLVPWLDITTDSKYDMVHEEHVPSKVNNNLLTASREESEPQVSEALQESGWRRYQINLQT